MRYRNLPALGLGVFLETRLHWFILSFRDGHLLKIRVFYGFQWPFTLNRLRDRPKWHIQSLIALETLTEHLPIQSNYFVLHPEIIGRRLICSIDLNVRTASVQYGSFNTKVATIMLSSGIIHAFK